jgi:hypothetical protein
MQLIKVKQLEVKMPKVKVSEMTGKLLNIPAINTNTITNPFCMKSSKSKNEKNICTKCYSVYMLSTYRKNCQNAFEYNSDLLSQHVLAPEQLPRLNAAYVRFNGHGELINSMHVLNIFRIVRHNPQTTFALWTKRKDLLVPHLDSLPDNLILVYSNPIIDKVMVKPPRGFHKVFNNVTEDPNENCTGQKCFECLACYKKDSGTDVIIEAVK